MLFLTPQIIQLLMIRNYGHEWGIGKGLEGGGSDLVTSRNSLDILLERLRKTGKNLRISSCMVQIEAVYLPNRSLKYDHYSNPFL
jgi:hypothetical protein